MVLACRQGLAAWMRAWPQELPTPPMPAGVGARTDTLPADLRGQVTLVLANMILTHQQEVLA
jgi:hypothetical protein